MGKRRKVGGKVESARRAIAAVGPRSCAVLVIEPEPELQWKLAHQLTVLGHRVVGTSSAEGARALLRHWPVDLVLVAEAVPGTTGVELAKELRASHPKAPVVLMTRSESPLLRAEAMLHGVWELLVKPFRLEVIAELIGRLPEPVPAMVAS